jgi:uncharacterized protein YndB with AHSA1/START domain
MAGQTKAPTESALVIERIVNAPRELVFQAWTDPEMFKRWWGPKGWTTSHCTIEPRAGGVSHFNMQAPDGSMTIWCKGVYTEFSPYDRIVFTDSFADKEGNVVPATEYGMEGVPLEMLVSVTFEDAGAGKTKMTMRHEGLPAGEHTEGANQGWSESFDKLVAYLSAMQD